MANNVKTFVIFQRLFIICWHSIRIFQESPRSTPAVRAVHKFAERAIYVRAENSCVWTRFSRRATKSSVSSVATL